MMTLLHIDDEDDILAVARMALEDVGGFTVTSGRSGKEALALARSLRPDLILLDVMMPEMDGPTTLTALRACPETAGIPVVFMTAKVQTHELQRFASLGALGVVTKPFDPMTLSEEVKALWASTAAAK